MAPLDPWIGPRGSAGGRLLEILRERGPMTRPQAAALTGMSPSGLRPLVARLVADGHLVERPATSRTGPGRPGSLLVPVLSDDMVLGVDLGHTHVAVAVADLHGTVLAERRAEVDVDHDATATLDLARSLASTVVAQGERAATSPVRIAVGVPGPVDRDGRLQSPTILAGWRDTSIATAFAGALDVDEGCVEVHNDAHLGAVGEHRLGAGRGHDDLVYVKASHGLGAGLVLGGRLHQGARGITGEFGHTVVEPDGALCRCGSRGCLETVVSVARVAEQVRFVRGPADSGTSDLAGAGDHPAARRILTETGRVLGRALADLCNLLDPELVVIGGELARVDDAIIDGVAESIRRFAQPAAGAVPVVRAELGDRAELLGAVSLAAGSARRPAGPRR